MKRSLCRRVSDLLPLILCVLVVSTIAAGTARVAVPAVGHAAAAIVAADFDAPAELVWVYMGGVWVPYPWGHQPPGILRTVRTYSAG